VRRHFSDVFPYAIFYMNQPQRIWIVAVMHMTQIFAEKRHPPFA